MNVADQCRSMGLQIGDTIIGRREIEEGYWREASITLLWFGERNAVWLEKYRNSSDKQWTDPIEKAGWWPLGQYDWKKVEAPST